MVLNFNTGWKAIAPTVEIPHCCISKAIEAIKKVLIYNNLVKKYNVEFDILDAAIQILSKINTLCKITFDPEVIFQCFSYQFSSMIINERVFTDCYSPKSWHSVKIWTAIT